MRDIKAALEPFRCNTPDREVELLDHLKDCGPMLYDIDLEVLMAPEGGTPTTIAGTNYREMYYSAAQQLAHHATSGCPMNTGDLLGSGTILREVEKAADILASDYDVTADIWSATSFSELRREGLDADRWNIRHPDQDQRVPYVAQCLDGAEGPFIAATDYSRI